MNQICDLCRGSDWWLAAEETPGHHRAVVCKACGLICASPIVIGAELAKIYEAFEVAREGIGGADAVIRKTLLAEEERLAKEWGLGHIQQRVDIKGKRVLDLRCRTGALSSLMRHAGADVYSVEPFLANVNYAKEFRGINEVHYLPFTSFHELELPWLQQFDVAISLTDHVLGHAVSPRRLLIRLFEVLKPGGYLIFEEKDTLQPAHWYNRSLLDSGRAHLYHFTMDTTERYLKSARFEVEDSAIDKKRITNFHHGVFVARKPEEALGRPFTLAPACGRRPEEVWKHLLQSERGLKKARLRQMSRDIAIALGARRVLRLLRRSG